MLKQCEKMQFLFDYEHAFDNPTTIVVITIIVAGLVFASIAIRLLRNSEKISAELFQELLLRVRSWYVLVIAMILPILLGHFWVCLFFFLLSLFCFREYAKTSGLQVSRSTMLSVCVAILVTYFAAWDHWMGLFTASWALGVCAIAVVALLKDQPQGYIQRVTLAITGYALFGISLSHLAYLSNDELFRPMLLWILLCTELNDVFAFVAGKCFGRRKLLPNTSPSKTWAGAIGAILLTTLFSTVLGYYTFENTSLSTLPHLVAMGLIISILGQCGDLVVSSIKRDLGVKDMADTIPGHGGLLDRFDSLLLVAPVLFHYINYFKESGIGGSQAVRIFTGN